MKISGRTELFILNLLIISIYFTVFAGFHFGISEHIMFSTNDAKSYLDVANLRSGSTEIDSMSIRPFLFPLLIALSYKTVGVFGLWFLQFLSWLLSINLLFLSVKKICNNAIPGFIAAILCACNLTFIVLTLHALTEVVTLFLLSFLLFFITHSIERKRELGFIHRVLFMVVLLTVIKPLFYPLVLGILFLILPLFYFKQYKQHSKKLITLLLVLSPLLFQQSLMKIKYNVFTVSKISDITLRDYFFAQGYSSINKMERDSTLIAVKQFDNAQIKNYISKHEKEYWQVFKTNLGDNCNGYPLYLDYPAGQGNPAHVKFMVQMNNRYYHLHFIFFPLILITLLLLIIHKKTNEFIILAVPSALLYYILLSSGISAYQGDRLTLPFLIPCIFSYFMVICYLYSFLLKWIKKRSPSHSGEHKGDLL